MQAEAAGKHFMPGCGGAALTREFVQTGGAGGSKRSSVRAGKGDDRVLDRTPLAPGEAGAEIIRSANPWTRTGPSDDHERLLRNVKRRVASATFAPRSGALLDRLPAPIFAPSHSVLNKITPEKFDRLMEQLLVCCRRVIRGRIRLMRVSGSGNTHSNCAEGDNLADF